MEADLLTLAEVGDARGRYDVAIGTWWETVPALWRLDATHRVVLLQSFEQRFYDSDAPFERLSAECMLAMPLHFIAVADWMRALLEELRPRARCWVARPGGSTRSASARPARCAGRAAPHPDRGGAQPAVQGGPRRGGGRARDARAGPVDARGPRSRRYGRARCGPCGHGAGAGRDGRAVPRARRAVEALARRGARARAGRGLPLRASVRRVALPGHSEYARHGENAMVVGFDDVPGTAAALDLLAGDRYLLARLSVGAVETAAELARHARTFRADPLRGGVGGGGERPAGHGRAAPLPHARARRRTGPPARPARPATEEALAVAQELVHELSLSRDDAAGSSRTPAPGSRGSSARPSTGSAGPRSGPGGSAARMVRRR